MENIFRTDITADPTQFNAAMDAAGDKAMSTGQRMQSAFRETFSKISDSTAESFKTMNMGFDSVTEGLVKFRGALAAVAAVALGGGMFGKFAADAANGAIATERMASVLGTTLEKATALRIALGEIGADTESYTTMISKMTVKLRDGEERFNELGIVTRGANHELLSTDEIFQNALKALMQFREGTDRNLASTEAFGRGWNEVIKYMRLTPEAIEAAHKKAEELGLNIGGDGVEAAHRYQKAHADLKFAIEGVGKAIGEQMLPQITKTSIFMAEQGPAMATTFKTALQGVGLVVGSVWLTLKDMGDAIGAIAAQAAALASGSWSQMRAIGAMRDEQAQKNEAEYERMKAMFSDEASGGAGAGAGAGPGGNKPYTHKAKKDPAEKSAMSGWETELATKRDAYEKDKLDQGSLQKFTLQMESDFWKNKKDLEDNSKQESEAATRKYYVAEAGLRTQAFEGDIADIHERIARQKAGSIERIQLAGDAAAKIGLAFGVESKEYKKAIGEESKMAEESGKQRQKLEEMALERTKESKVAAIELERQALDDAEKLGLISADKKLARLKQLKELEYQIELQGLTDTAAIYDLDEVAYQQHLDKIGKLKEKHALDMKKIDGQVAAESKKSLDAWLDPIGNGFKTLMDGMIQGTQTWAQAVRKSLLAVGTEYLSEGMKWLVNHVKIEILKTQATTAGVAARTAAEQEGAGQSLLITAWTAIKNITAAAWEAAAAAFKAIVGIPVIGPELAPVVAAGAAATVLGFAGNISAAGGFDVPRGLNPVAQLHQSEMVLPAHLADAVRAMAGGGGNGGGDTLNVNVNTIDNRGFKALLMDNKSMFADALKSAYRDGKR